MRTEGTFSAVDLLLSGGRWWRFSDYELTDGYLRPTRDAQLEAYDPWADYRNARIGRRRGQPAAQDGWIPPYAEFTNLLKNMEPEPVLDFCRRYGLPGILLHQTQVVTLAPRWVAIEDGQLRVPGQLQFIRTNTGWAQKRSLSRPSTLEQSIGKPELAGTLVPEEEAPKAWVRVGVLRGNLRTADVEFENLNNTWAKFFPDISDDDVETSDYPPPLSDGFWRAYGEPYSVFLDSIQILSETLWELQHHRPTSEMSKADEQHRLVGVDLLHNLIAPTSVSIIPMADGTFTQQWVCHSLLSTFAMMALHDLTGSKRVRACVECGRMYVSQHPAARYCREQCRWVSQKRNQRERQQQKISGRASPAPASAATRKGRAK